MPQAPAAPTADAVTTRPTGGAAIVLALALLAFGLLAVLRVGGEVAGAAGLVGIAVGLVVFCRTVFRLAEGASAPSRHETEDGRLR